MLTKWMKIHKNEIKFKSNKTYQTKKKLLLNMLKNWKWKTKQDNSYRIVNV